ncbi:uncharacterized protein P174DRAFT_499663 [Aspergillus novofumigatus IBT 16806]|uniref:Uncharacterized protein n=1 Tax=Aspergillus novofumigatus (strain IBT 16806) TaxID=1392255 RepID=A0A2I1CJS9_ASPN1|nr:uncharacterized protein P174DRAFT_499663 [Aspergillus novofumigatus IBT 16806]PKX97882.1 hypothetical protein P174DRAFT_499663 [Aspergillus novofumigatus IBT 16806]
MPRLVMFAGDVPLLEDIRDPFMTWLIDSDVQEALPPIEKGWYDSFASGSIRGLSECLLANSELSDSFTHWFSAAAACHTSNTAYMVNAYTSAAKVAFRQAKTTQAAKSGTLQGLGRDQMERLPLYWRLRLSGDSLLTQAIEVGVDTVEGWRSGEMLELLVQGRALYLSEIADPQESEKNPHADRIVANSEVGFLMGKYYRAFGRNIEAMACYAAQVKQCIRLSSDNDPLNDGMAFRRLGDVFAGLGTRSHDVASELLAHSIR